MRVGGGEYRYLSVCLVDVNPKSSRGREGEREGRERPVFYPSQPERLFSFRLMALRGIAGSTEVADSIDGAGAANTTVSSSYDDASRKIRKPYTITKSRESWTEQEHDHFLEALQLFDRDWKKIEAFIGSKTAIQIRSHAQKYFLKVQKNGTGEHVPPPRPKRKASHPYPQKAPKNEGKFVLTDPSSATRKSITTAVPCSWGFCCVQPDSVSQLAKEELCPSGATVAGNCSSVSAESCSGTWENSESINQGDNAQLLHVMPDFEQVYSFLGSVFDPSSSGHLQKLKEMNPIDVETVLLLMKNVAVNLISSNFKSHIKLLLSYEADGDAEEVKSVASRSLVGNVVNAPFMLESA